MNDADRAGWLADKICNGNDYCKEAAMLLVKLGAENEKLRQALRFYGHKHHMELYESSAWDIVSGEPTNYLCDEAGTATVEDGTVARMALRGEHLDDDEPLPPIDGEPKAQPSPADERSERDNRCPD